jgi:multidrug resistance efflux pump
MSAVRALLARWWPAGRVRDLEAQLAAVQAEKQQLMANVASLTVLLAAARASVTKREQDLQRRLDDAERKLAEQPPAHDCASTVAQLQRNLARAEQTIGRLQRDREALWARLDAQDGFVDPDLVVAS